MINYYPKSKNPDELRGDWKVKVEFKQGRYYHYYWSHKRHQWIMTCQGNMSDRPAYRNSNRAIKNQDIIADRKEERKKFNKLNSHWRDNACSYRV